MAKASSDRNTIDLFGKTRGRPKTHPLPRKDQLKLNKRTQRLKEKSLGLKRLELTVDEDTIQKLDEICANEDIKRSDWLTMQVALAFSKRNRASTKKTNK